VSGILVIAASVTLILLSASEFINPYRTITEVTSNTNGFMGQSIQLIGTIVNGSVQLVGGELVFTITDGGSALNVVHAGSMPQNFKEGIDVVVKGNLVSDSTFHSNQILTKCPSKYE
jgi:cytochrome c-type biogenesis protein CcmE